MPIQIVAKIYIVVYTKFLFASFDSAIYKQHTELVSKFSPGNFQALWSKTNFAAISKELMYQKPVNDSVQWSYSKVCKIKRKNI